MKFTAGLPPPLTTAAPTGLSAHSDWMFCLFHQTAAQATALTCAAGW